MLKSSNRIIVRWAPTKGGIKLEPSSVGSKSPGKETVQCLALKPSRTWKFMKVRSIHGKMVTSTQVYCNESCLYQGSLGEAEQQCIVNHRLNIIKTSLQSIVNHRLTTIHPAWNHRKQTIPLSNTGDHTPKHREFKRRQLPIVTFDTGLISNFGSTDLAKRFALPVAWAFHRYHWLIHGRLCFP